MAKRNLNFYFRKTHRYLGIFIGIQFLMWTIGGLYFSWNNLDEIHGDHLMDSVKFLSSYHNFVSPGVPLGLLGEKEDLDSLLSVQLIEVLGKPYYQIAFIKDSKKKAQMADAVSGQLRSPITESEAIQMA